MVWMSIYGLQRRRHNGQTREVGAGEGCFLSTLHLVQPTVWFVAARFG